LANAFAHFSLAPHASIGDNPALSESNGAGAEEIRSNAQG